MDAMQIAMTGSIILFLGATLYSIIQIGIIASKSDTKSNMASAIISVSVVNSILMLVMAGIAYFYLRTNQAAVLPYTLIMIHVTLLVSVVSVSISSLQQINSS
jgi:hypothetical protein